MRLYDETSKPFMGICRKIDSEEKIAIIPQETDLLEENQLVIIISSEEFYKISGNFKNQLEFMESIKCDIDSKKDD